MWADASIGPYKWGLGLQQEIYVPTRRGEGTHLQPKRRTCGSVGLRNAPAGAAPYGYFVGVATRDKMFRVFGSYAFRKEHFTEPWNGYFLGLW